MTDASETLMGEAARVHVPFAQWTSLPLAPTAHASLSDTNVTLRKSRAVTPSPSIDHWLPFQRRIVPPSPTAKPLDGERSATDHNVAVTGLCAQTLQPAPVLRSIRPLVPTAQPSSGDVNATDRSRSDVIVGATVHAAPFQCSMRPL